MVFTLGIMVFKNQDHNNVLAEPESYGDIRALPLLTTKLYRPPVTTDLEPRNRLIEQLEPNSRRAARFQADAPNNKPVAALSIRM